MTKKLIKQGPKAISFDIARSNGMPGATRAQLALLKKLNECVRKGKPLKREDVHYIYVFYIACGEDKDAKFWVRKWENGEYKNVNTKLWDYYYPRGDEEPYGDFRRQDRAGQWLKNNIGAMVLKNMLIAIPVFDVE